MPNQNKENNNNKVPFEQLKKRGKHRWRSVALLKVTFLHGYFLRFFNCTTGIKLHNTV